MTWQPMDTAPTDGRAVLLRVSTPDRPVTIVAWYAPPRSVETDDDSGQWDEASGQYYAPEGWYEQSVYGEDERVWRVTDTPTHWAAMPPSPEVQQ